MVHYSIQQIVSGFFAAMLAAIVSLTFFLREVYFVIESFEITLPEAHPRKALADRRNTGKR